MLLAFPSEPTELTLYEPSRQILIASAPFYDNRPQVVLRTLVKFTGVNVPLLTCREDLPFPVQSSARTVTSVQLGQDELIIGIARGVIVQASRKKSLVDAEARPDEILNFRSGHVRTILVFLQH